MYRTGVVLGVEIGLSFGKIQGRKAGVKSLLLYWKKQGKSEALGTGIGEAVTRKCLPSFLALVGWELSGSTRRD